MGQHPTPKLRGVQRNYRDRLFPYYAAFSSAFARSVLTQLKLCGLRSVFDPWNGSGTVTLAARMLGFRTVGTDINPAMILVAKAKLCNRDSARRALDQANKALRSPVSRSTNRVSAGDPLRHWFKKESAAFLRTTMRSLRIPQMIKLESRTINVSAERAIIALTMFRTIRGLLGQFRTSNPTWIKMPNNDSRLLSVSKDRLCKLFEAEARKVCRQLDPASLPHPNSASIRLAESCALCLPTNSFDICLTSPPYCTRIDYAVATLPELAVIFPVKGPIRELRDTLISTVVVPRKSPRISTKWGKTCKSVLTRVKSHSSKASISYYFPTLLGYFKGLKRSLLQIRRVLKREGRLIIVTQGSYYKNIRIDLPRIVNEMLGVSGFFRTKATYYYNKNSLINIHNSSITGQNRNALPEVVQWFKKK